MFTQSLLTGLALVLAQPADQPTASSSEPTIEKCDVAAIQDLAVPTSDPGVLISLAVKPGVAVKKGDKLGIVDDRDAKALAKVKQAEYDIAKQKAESDVDIRNAKTAAEVAKKAYEKYEYIRNKEKNAVTEIDYLRTYYEYKKAELTIEKTVEEAKANVLTAGSKKAELDAALVALDRRTLVAPFDGVVVKTYASEGEWLQAGEPVIQVVRIDRFRVYGNLDAQKWGRGDLEGRKCTIDVVLPRGRKLSVPGRIVFVSPVVGVGAKLPVWAEAETPMENDRPLIYAGMDARMTIHTDQPVADDARPAAPPTPRSASKK
jgi:multidrug efflux pump subunit AcrA (membrane-fusion protein)